MCESSKRTDSACTVRRSDSASLDFRLRLQVRHGGFVLWRTGGMRYSGQLFKLRRLNRKLKTCATFPNSHAISEAQRNDLPSLSAHRRNHRGRISRFNRFVRIA